MARAGAVSFAIPVLAFNLGGTPAVAQVEVNTCGQSYSGKGFLAGDLDCTSSTGYALTIEKGNLDLRGFTLRGGEGVYCLSSCTIFSEPPGGTITGSTGSGVVGDSAVAVEDVLITGNTSFGVYAGRAKIKRSTVSGSGYRGVYVYGGPYCPGPPATVHITDSIISDNGSGGGVFASGCLNGFSGRLQGFVKVIRSEVRSNGGYGVRADRGIKVIDSVIADNADSALGDGRVNVVRSTVINNRGSAVTAWGSFRVKDSMITGNDGGVYADGEFVSSGRVSNSTITDNGSGAGCSVMWRWHCRLKIQGSTIDRNGVWGVAGDRVIVRDSVINSNGEYGIKGRNRVLVRGSQVVGNGTRPSCGVSVTCADIASFVEPRFELVPGTFECDTSYVRGSGVPGDNWGVCVLD